MPYSVALGAIPVVANANVRPRRFVVPVTGSGNGQRAIEATGSTRCYLGISKNWLRYPPGSPSDDGFIAVAGENLAYAGPLETTELDIGSTAITDCGTPLKSDANGLGTPMLTTGTTAEWVGALPWRTCAASETIPVLVLSPFRQFPALS